VDGRWVPTIAAPAQEIASSRRLGSASQCTSTIPGTDGNYSWCTGTSMAAPHTSGTIVLATQWWRSFNGGVNPSPAMAKALLVNSADDIGVPDIPNINEGWGRINLTTLIDPPVHREYRDQTDLFTEAGQQLVIPVGVADPGQPLKVTLAWSDAPGAVGANPALVNNLDLTVDTGGDVYLGNVFSSGWSATGGSPDTINNLENVFVQNPGSSAIITIDAINIAGDGVPYNGQSVDQDLVLVCSNCASQPDFTVDVSPSDLSLCAPADGLVDVSIGSILGFTDPVTLGVVGAPAGTSTVFDVNPVTPPGNSRLTIEQTGSAAPGFYSMEVGGTSTTGEKSRFVDLEIFDAHPSAPVQATPINGATNQPTMLTFEWTEASQGDFYSLEVATDPIFADVVFSMWNIEGTSYTLETDLDSSSIYFWRVHSANACGAGGWSEVWFFVTEASPGDCDFGFTPAVQFSDDFETGAPNWTHSAATGPDTWTLNGGISGTHSGSFVYHVDDIDDPSDQRLVSPEVILPNEGFPITLQFWNYQHLESKLSGCWDGTIVEISVDGGTNWTHLPTTLMLTDPYDGPVTGLGEIDGWCGDPQDWIKAVVDLEAYAGATVRFRFRIGTDSSVYRPGWDIDDVAVRSCVEVAPSLPFVDGFESGDTTAWSTSNP
jgi:hypothetical protein